MTRATLQASWIYRCNLAQQVLASAFLNDLDFVKSAGEGKVFRIKLHIIVKAKVILKYIFVPFDFVHYLYNMMRGLIFNKMVVC